MPDVKVEDGKTYRTRAGHLSTITGTFKEGDLMYETGYRFIGGPCGQYYTENGMTYLDGPSSGDLIEEFSVQKTSYDQAREILDKHIGFARDEVYRLCRTDPMINKLYQCAAMALKEEIEKREELQTK